MIGGKAMTDEELDTMIRAEKAAYMREWRKRNPEKVRAAERRKWEKRVKARLAAQAEAANAAQT